MPRPTKIIWLFVAAILIPAVFLPGCNPPERAAEKPAEPQSATSEPQGASRGSARLEPAASASPLSNTERSGQSKLKPSPALAAFLPKFDALSAKGFVPTLRRGSTGIGYTLETMLDIPENNSPLGDFMGMELKAWRDNGEPSEYAEKMNLFLKEPKWVDGLKSADRVRKYGYIDPNGRPGLYSTVTIDTNSHQLGLSIDQETSRLWMSFAGKRIAYWDFAILEKRLNEKHTETVFVAAHTRGEGTTEEFHYFGVNWCREPSVESFLTLMREGDVFLELRMHVKESGTCRNHGSCFRIHRHRLKDLFRYSDHVRPARTAAKEKQLAR